MSRRRCRFSANRRKSLRTRISAATPCSVLIERRNTVASSGHCFSPPCIYHLRVIISTAPPCSRITRALYSVESVKHSGQDEPPQAPTARSDPPLAVRGVVHPFHHTGCRRQQEHGDQADRGRWPGLRLLPRWEGARGKSQARAGR